MKNWLVRFFCSHDFQPDVFKKIALRVQAGEEEWICSQQRFVCLMFGGYQCEKCGEYK